MVAIIDYGAGNIMSVQKACAYLGFDYILTRQSGEILSADHVILPGVGAFGEAMERLREFQLDYVLAEVKKRGIPLLGICLGLQLFFEDSEESPGVRGLGLLPGSILAIPNGKGELKIPHMGWNLLSFKGKGRLFDAVPEGTYVYFVHSYYLPEDTNGLVNAVTDYGVRIGAALEDGNLFACQFHPEKSSVMGLRILSNFLKV